QGAIMNSTVPKPEKVLPQTADENHASPHSYYQFLLRAEYTALRLSPVMKRPLKPNAEMRLTRYARNPKSPTAQQRQGQPTKHSWKWSAVQSAQSSDYKSSIRA